MDSVLKSKNRKEEEKMISDKFIEGENKNGAEIVNLTPHKILVFNETNKVVCEIASSGVARAESEIVTSGNLAGIPIKKVHFGKPIGLPDFELGKWFVVSRVTAEAAKFAGRDTSDLLLTVDSVRDESGRIVGCRGFSFFG